MVSVRRTRKYRQYWYIIVLPISLEFCQIKQFPSNNRILSGFRLFAQWSKKQCLIGLVIESVLFFLLLVLCTMKLKSSSDNQVGFVIGLITKCCLVLEFASFSVLLFVLGLVLGAFVRSRAPLRAEHDKAEKTSKLLCLSLPRWSLSSLSWSLFNRSDNRIGFVLLRSDNRIGFVVKSNNRRRCDFLGTIEPSLVVSGWNS